MTRLQADKGTWYWAVHFKREGKLQYRRFYDPKYGGTTKSKKAARGETRHELPEDVGKLKHYALPSAKENLTNAWLLLGADRRLRL